MTKGESNADAESNVYERAIAIGDIGGSHSDDKHFEPGFAYAASASEIDRNATQALTTLYNSTPGARLWPTNQRQYLFSRASSRAASSSPGNMAMGRCASTAGRLATIDRLRPRTVFRQGLSRLAMCLFFMDEASVKYLNKSEWLGTRNWAESRSVGQGIRQEFVNDNTEEGGLRFYIQPERPDGWDRHAGIQNHQDQPW